MSEHIAVLTCGGTIAMDHGEGGELAPEITGTQLVESIPSLKEGNVGATFDVIELFDKDSTNVTPRDWGTVATKIAEMQHKNYDGVIVTHGTDTMAQTASAAALALGKGLAIPVVFTGSQLPLRALRTDAVQNVESAADVVLAAAREDEPIHEVMIVFSNQAMRAIRTIKTNEVKFAAFESPAFPHLADLTADDEIIFSPLANTERVSRHEFLEPQIAFDRGVREIIANTTTDPDIEMPSIMHPKTKAVILRSVGAGNVPDQDAKSSDEAEDIAYSFVPLIEETLAANKPVIITSSFVGGRARPEMYRPGKAAMEAGAGHAANMTDVAAKIKLMWLIGKGITDPEAVKEEMLIPRVGEVDLKATKKR